MDEQQMMQMLDQIPLETLYQYVQQRAAMEQQQGGGEEMMQQPAQYARGGYLPRNNRIILHRIR